MSNVKQLLIIFNMKYILLIVSIVIFVSCNETSKIEKEIEAIPVEVKVMRLDQEFGSATPETLSALKKKYTVFFPQQFHDSIWIGNMQDTIQQQLVQEINKVFPDNEKIEAQLVPLFRHLKYYFPEFKEPTVVGVTSDVDYQHKVIVADTLLVLALDTYLGSEHEFYENIKKYISINLKSSQIGPDVVKAYAQQLVSGPKQRTLLAQMVYFGKQLYLKDVLLPAISDAEKMGYTDAEMQWANDNEEDMWRYFIEKELLYNTDPKLAPRFILDAPFSKFYLEIDNESPGRIGQYLGWQMVRAFMENNDVTVPQLLIKSADEIFKNSKYKPTKN
ncbi:gliding motility lipoprotein GldB [Rasiella sp. SM2506]|uniref:gliding motility lipoprotein GldB n=1 Tax=Rasiella sp. SM2506 TaxID=3423914 RepID=UPI003D7AD388